MLLRAAKGRHSTTTYAINTHLPRVLAEVPQFAMKVLGVEFAPLNVPLKRRLQTASVLYLAVSFVFGGFFWSALFAYVFFYTSYYYIPLLYAIWYLYDRDTPKRGGRQSRWVRQWRLLKYAGAYYPAKLVKTSDLTPARNYILGYHPHGIMCMGAMCNFGTEASGIADLFPGIRIHVLTLNVNFMFPIQRELLMFHGLCSVDRQSLDWILTKQGTGNAAVIAVGGAQESLDAHKDSYIITLKNRKGFIRCALKSGADLVPVFSFGENNIFYQLKNPRGSWLRWLQEKLKSITGVAPPIFYGRGILQYTWGYMPFREKIVSVVGSPIRVEKNENPTDEEVDLLHEKYMASLRQLFEVHKEQYASKECTLTIV
ncbi:2-acylglycerol O-acyltransferase 2-A-like isoform X1 [Dermacentor andersoni]|uniref:2-acylglycerol O-acyltransferase 2-A-like isoform X1 n=2 Tax=Dermacentor andersoni TaxID=34620 RepID=UPI0024166374|nr:2-acylglycerol O-acyltransferase 2-A-like isoform X1 [Dermacentor andersoni]